MKNEVYQVPPPLSLSLVWHGLSGQANSLNKTSRTENSSAWHRVTISRCLYRNTRAAIHSQSRLKDPYSNFFLIIEGLTSPK